jgi:hypothetical protein
LPRADFSPMTLGNAREWACRSLLGVLNDYRDEEKS